MIASRILASILVFAATPVALAYDPPAKSKELLVSVDFAKAKPLDEDYRLQFSVCDRGISGIGKKDHFRGHSLRLSNKPESKQYYLCSRDPSNVSALLKLADGGVLWESKMALDVDGSWAAWNGIPGATDQKQTSLKWPDIADKSSKAAQIDPDRIPFVVMPMDGLKKLTGSASPILGAEFSKKTGLQLGDLGIVVYGSAWTPVIIADGGPFMRLGEGSSRVFESIGESRCKQWNSTGTACVGKNHKYPYKNFGISHGVIFILYPQSRQADMTAANAISRMCDFAKLRLNLSGGATCP